MEDRQRIALFLVFALAFVLKLHFATAQPLIYNNDAGYYVIHINEVLEQGYPDADAPPLAFYYAGVFAAIFGTMLGFKVAISLASAAIAFPVYKTTRLITGHGWTAVFAAFLAAFSGVNMFMMGDLLKNQLGLLFGAWAIYFLLRATERFSYRSAGMCVAMLLMMVLSHFSSSGYIVFSIAPFLLLLPAYSYRKAGGLGKEHIFCLALFALLLLTGALIILVKGWDIGDAKIGVVGLQEYSHFGINLSLFMRYSVFSILLILGIFQLQRSGTRHTFLFLPWLLMSFLLSQHLISDEAFTFRFEWNSYFLIAILSAVGLRYFRDEKLICNAIAILLAVYTLNAFWTSGQAIGPIITQDEWDGLLALHNQRPDIVFRGMEGIGLGYWVEAAGFDVVAQGSPGAYQLICASERTGDAWLDGACMQSVQMSPEDLQRPPVREHTVAHFGRFYVLSQTPMPDDAIAQGMDVPPNDGG